MTALNIKYLWNSCANGDIMEKRDAFPAPRTQALKLDALSVKSVGAFFCTPPDIATPMESARLPKMPDSVRDFNLNARPPP